jgi:hypothetical protein
MGIRHVALAQASRRMALRVRKNGVPTNVKDGS